MKTGQTVYVIHRAKNVFCGVLGDENEHGAQGFYTRWGPAYTIYFRNAAKTVNTSTYNKENIFSTKEAAKKEMFMRNLRYPQLRGAA